MLKLFFLMREKLHFLCLTFQAINTLLAIDLSILSCSESIKRTEPAI